jgi:hypothetical protein
MLYHAVQARPVERMRVGKNRKYSFFIRWKKAFKSSIKNAVLNSQQPPTIFVEIPQFLWSAHNFCGRTHNFCGANFSQNEHEFCTFNFKEENSKDSKNVKILEKIF